MAKASSPRSAVLRLFENSDQPVYVLNGRREIIFANASCETWLDCKIESLIGKTCVYHSGEPADQIQAVVCALCPPPDLFSGPDIECTALIRNPRSKEPCLAHFHAMRDTQRLLGVVAFVDLDTNTIERPWSQDSEQAKALHHELAKINRHDNVDWNADLTIGQGSWIQEALQLAKLASETDSHVLIAGEAGTGRRDLATKIHLLRKKGALDYLIPIDCLRLESESLQKLITETVDQERMSRNQIAPHFLLLDVDKLDENSQIELAGLIKLPGLDFRLLSISGRTKDELLASDDFDADLARLLGPLAISIPPLRKRREDIPLLAQDYLEEHNVKTKKQLAGFTAEALDELTAYHWPANVAQLRQFIFEACDKAAGDFLTVNDLPKQIKLAADFAQYPAKEVEAINLDEFLAQIEVELIDRAIKKAKGNKTKAAEMLGITRARLHRRIALPEK